MSTAAPPKEHERIPAENAERLRQYNTSEAGRVAADIQRELVDRASLFGVPAEMLTQPFVPICSVWPSDLIDGPYHHGGVGRKYYSIGAGSPITPTVVLIQSTFDWIQRAGPEGKAELEAGVIPAADLAKNLVQTWCGDHPGNVAGKRGVGIIRGEIVPNDGITPTIAGISSNWTVKPTKEEVAFLASVQTSYLQWLVDRADEYSNSRNPVDQLKIGKEHRDALKILGVDEKQHPWYRSKSVVLYSKCPFCQNMVLRTAIFCVACRNSIVDYFVGRNLTPSVEEWPRVVEDMERMNVIKVVPTVEPKKTMPVKEVSK